MCKGILIADDNAPARQVMRVALERAGLTVCAEAADGLDAVDKASELKPDLIVLDLRLPRLNGIEAAHVLHGRLPNTPIVLFTMFDVDRKSTRLNSSHLVISYAVFCLKKKKHLLDRQVAALVGLRGRDLTSLAAYVRRQRTVAHAAVATQADAARVWEVDDSGLETTRT